MRVVPAIVVDKYLLLYDSEVAQLINGQPDPLNRSRIGTRPFTPMFYLRGSCWVNNDNLANHTMQSTLPPLLTLVSLGKMQLPG